MLFSVTDEQGSKPNLSALPGTCFLASKPLQPSPGGRESQLHGGSGVKREQQYLDPQYSLHYQSALPAVHCSSQALRADSTYQLSTHLNQMAAMAQVDQKQTVTILSY